MNNGIFLAKSVTKKLDHNKLERMEIISDEILPEIGSRAFRNIYVVEMKTKSADGEGCRMPMLLMDWVDVQEGFYKYQVYFKNGQVWVKMIIRDFLYCEVVMALDDLGVLRCWPNGKTQHLDIFLWYFEKDSIICTCIFGGGKIMLKLIVFETEEERCELTGLTEHELWQKGFNLDDWEIGFQSEVKLHKTPTKKDIENGYRENELIALFDLPAHWLMSQMNAYCVGANYVFLDGKHYYTVHHA